MHGEVGIKILLLTVIGIYIFENIENFSKREHIKGFHKL